MRGIVEVLDEISWSLWIGLCLFAYITFCSPKPAKCQTVVGSWISETPKLGYRSVLTLAPDSQATYVVFDTAGTSIGARGNWTLEGSTLCVYSMSIEGPKRCFNVWWYTPDSIGLGDAHYQRGYRRMKIE